MRTYFQTRTIRELPKERNGKRWLCLERGTYYKTASYALNAIKREDKKLAVAHDIVITEITWEPITRAGKIIVKAML